MQEAVAVRGEVPNEARNTSRLICFLNLTSRPIAEREPAFNLFILDFVLSGMGDEMDPTDTG